MGTAASRVTGLLRTVALAWALGVGTVSDAYNTANTAPNMLFALVAGGVLSSALVPMLAAARSEESRVEDASVVLGTVTALSVAMGAAMFLSAPWLMQMLASGASGRAGQQELLDLGTQWMRVFALQIPCYAVSVAAMGVLTSRRRLTLGAAAGVATNVVTIAAAVGFVVLSGTSRPRPTLVPSDAVAILGWGTTLGVALMAGIQLWEARRALPGLRFTPRWRHRAVVELRRLGGWMLLYVAVNQIGLAAVIVFASTITGGVSGYQWAFMLMQLPYAVVAVSLFSSAFPDLAGAASRGEDLRPRFTSSALRTVDLLLPAAAGLALLAGPLAVVAVGAGAPLVHAALLGFAASLLPFSLFQLLCRVSYAGADARRPAMVNIVVNAAMLAVDLVVLALPLGSRGSLTGLALGHAASYVVGCAVLHRSLRRSGALVLAGSALVRGAAAPVLATAALAAVVLVLPVPVEGTRLESSLWLVAATVVGAAVYGVAHRYVASSRSSPAEVH